MDELEYNPDLDDNHVFTDQDVYGDIEQELENLLKIVIVLGLEF